MANWAGGYPSEERYLDTIQLNTTPTIMDAGLLAQGLALPHGAGAYRYCELGCGTAFSMTALAASNPQSTFEGYDIMPEHVVRAMSLIEEAGLSNIEVKEASFEELLAGPAPEPFDYMVLHGVWSWVSAENQGFLVELLARWLKPGGVAYIGYSAAAGWMSLGPMRRLFRELPPGPPDSPYGPARAAVEAYIKLHPGSEVAQKWERYRDLPDSYLAHDFGASEASAQWPTEMAAALAPAKLTYLCPANLIEQFGPLLYNPDQLQFIGQAMQEGWGETARDLATEATFRGDLYGKGIPRVPSKETWRRLSQMTLTQWRPCLKSEKQHSVLSTLRPWDEAMVARIDAVFAKGEMTVADFVEKLALPQKEGLQMALALLARDEACVVRPAAEVAAANEGLAGFQAALKRRHLDGASLPGVASARLMGPKQLSDAELDALFGVAEPDAQTSEGFAQLALPEV
ncbi:MAG: class I SAM-dependent methyltransferase [Pseudomonadota bacterium]